MIAFGKTLSRAGVCVLSSPSVFTARGRRVRILTSVPLIASLLPHAVPATAKRRIDERKLPQPIEFEAL
ncbi:MAG: hypothetical protein M3120_04310 [Pseudomonadota bacterium]|nr:hypothetical protein [Pseudomonadota bacterium]